MKRMPGRPSVNSGPADQNLKGTVSRDNLAQEVGESAKQIQRYIRLTELIPQLLEMVDDNKIALRPAVEISYLPKTLQKELLDNIEMEACTPSHDQTLRMRNLLRQNKLTPEVITMIMQEEKPNQKEKIILRDDRTRNLLPKNLPVSQREEYIIKALEHYGRYLKKQREQER